MRSILLMSMVLAALSFGSQAATAATTYSYDDLGRIATVTFDNGKQIVYTYDASGNRSSVVVSP